ncbi:hypothetical protein pb186bvf_000121 [Paramecium bursaria]
MNNNFDFLLEYQQRNDAVNNKKGLKQNKFNSKFDKQIEPVGYERFVKESFFENPWKKNI